MKSRNEHRFEKKFRSLQGLYLWFSDVLKDRAKLPLFKKLIYIKNGFLPIYCTLYDFNRFSMKSYLDDRKRRTSIRNLYFGYGDIIDNKIAFSTLISKYAKVPALYCHIRNKSIIELENSKVNSFDCLITLLKRIENKCVVIKPVASGCGRGVFIIKYLPSEGFYINNNSIDIDELQNTIINLEDYFVSEFIEQGLFAKNIFSRTANTIRFQTMVDPDTNKAFIARAFHRFGRESSFPVDNGRAGGIISAINVDTGELVLACTRGEREYVYIEKHPDTDMALVGVTVPCWEKIVASVLDLANSVNYLVYLAWDVIAMDDGQIIILEGNNQPDMYALQMVEPLLVDDRICRFYHHHGIIKTASV